MKLDEGRVYGARYYTVQPMMTWSSTIRDWIDMEKWCTETFGPTDTAGMWIPNQQ